MKRVYEGTALERKRKATAAFRARDPERTRRQWRGYRERKLLALTGGRPKPDHCDICGMGGRVCFDHSHASGVFRGWLCNRCNLILGHATDDPAVLRRLADYLEVHDGGLC